MAFPTMIRTFIALEIPMIELNKIIQIRKDVIGATSRIRWEPIEKLHITLKYLGDTEESILQILKEELKSIVEDSKSFSLSFRKFGIFKKGNEPKILFVDFNDCINLNTIVFRIEDSFAKYGYKKETKAFKPHLTLLRLKRSEDKNEILKLLEVAIPQDSFEADAIHLFKSELKPAGSVYSSLQKYLLKN